MATTQPPTLTSTLALACGEGKSIVKQSMRPAPLDMYPKVQRQEYHELRPIKEFKVRLGELIDMRKEKVLNKNAKRDTKTIDTL